MPLVRQLASTLYDYELHEVLVGPYIMDKYDPALINTYLDYLRPDKMNVFVEWQEWKDLDQTEKWYGTKYNKKPLEKVRRLFGLWEDILSTGIRQSLPECDESVQEAGALQIA